MSEDNILDRVILLLFDKKSGVQEIVLRVSKPKSKSKNFVKFTVENSEDGSFLHIYSEINGTVKKEIYREDEVKRKIMERALA